MAALSFNSWLQEGLLLRYPSDLGLDVLLLLPFVIIGSAYSSLCLREKTDFMFLIMNLNYRAKS